MRLSRDSARNLAALAAVPALVLAVRAIGGAGAASATAAHPVNPPAARPLPDAALHVEQPSVPAERAALTWLNAVDMNSPVPSPMEVTQAPPETPAVAAPPPPEDHMDPELPTLRVTSVMLTRQGGVASINGRVVRVGELVAPGWTLTGIDVPGGAVVISRYDGLVRRVEQPR